MPEAHEQMDPLGDEDQLAKLGYKQELARTWSGFSNFAISFSIISILAGCLTTYGAGIGNGGPVSISWSWPIISAFIMIIGLTMSELVSSMPTSGGIYYWASKLGGPRAGFFTGWLNLIGLVAVTASVAYGCATFFDLTFQTWGWYSGASLGRIFLYFLAILVFIAVVNIFSSHLLAMLNNISVWWHVVGAAVLILVLFIVPSDHLSLHQVFTDRFNGSGWSATGSTGGLGFWLAIIPFGFILTQYTITGFDASVHLSEETQGAAKTAAKGIWQSILYSAIGGYVLLLAVTFAIPKVHGVPQYAQIPAGGVQYIFQASLGDRWAGTLLLISSLAQLFCATACLTSTSRMMFAFSRDRAVPGSALWSKVNASKTPVNAVICAAVVGALITLPALKGVNGIPTAFYAVTSVSVIGLYFSFAIPIYLRWRHGENFEVGSGWSNGAKYKWMNPVAVVEIIVVSVMLMLPTVPAGAPWRKEFDWASVNYAPFMTVGALILLAIWWMASARNWFKGPVRTIDETDEPVPAGVE